MNQIISLVDQGALLVGRFLLGIYFILPGITKIVGWDANVAYMEEHNVPMIPVLLTITIILQLGCGAMLIVGFKGRIAAFLLAGLTLAISIYMHNFWDYAEGMERNHETQNFVKNLAIMAGLLVVSSLGTGKFSLDNRLAARA